MRGVDGTMRRVAKLISGVPILARPRCRTETRPSNDDVRENFGARMRATRTLATLRAAQ